MTKDNRCPYWYHSVNNPMALQCVLKEGHSGAHQEPQLLPPPQQFQPVQGWVKHG